MKGGGIQYEIRLAGRLPRNWNDWCEGFVCIRPESGETVLAGALPDQAALIGLLSSLCQMNLTLRLVRRLD